jgi:Bacterial antitoxin of type II TA system, VapB
VRTTLSLDDDVLEAARSYAKTRKLAIGKAVSELVRRGLQAPLKTRIVNGFHVVDLSADSPPVTSADIKRLQDRLA